ncbi:MAG: thiamine-monophosphate kinase [Planctomycetes bacterium]|nr:thiamine-monophosphate kinase [Planctomycetota bacterium]
MPEPKGEWKLIEWIRSRTRLDPTAFPIGPGDDMALVGLGGESQCLLTVDALLEGTHFDLAKATPKQVGYKAMAVSLSDAAAMAAKPVCALAWAGLPESRGMAFAKDLSAGMAEAAEKFACPIVGGDITSWNQPLVTVGTALVARPAGIIPIRRSGAKAGDLLFVTGELGGSVLGRHLAFTPRVTEARQLAALVTIHAMIDLSDGLSTDLGHIARESGVAAEIMADAIPISDDAKRLAKEDGRAPLGHALNDGEDFELLLAVEPVDAQDLLKQNPLTSVRLTHIGRVVEGGGVSLVAPDGSRAALEPGGYEHFK